MGGHRCAEGRGVGSIAVLLLTLVFAVPVARGGVALGLGGCDARIPGVHPRLV